MQDMDQNKGITGPTLNDLAKNPKTAEMLLNVRGIRTRDRWEEIARKTDLASDEERRLICCVWKTMPGDTCFLDAARLVAFGPRPKPE